MGLISFKNVTKSRISSVLGVIIILASLVSVFYPGVSWGDAAVGIGVGLVLLGLKDPPLSGAASAGLVAVCTLALVGCASYTRCLDKYGVASAPSVVKVSDSVKVPVRITVPPDSLATRLDIDSLAQGWAADTLRLVSIGGQVQVEVWKSSGGKSGQLNLRTRVPERIVHDTITRYVTLYGQCPPGFTLQPKAKPPFYQPWWDYYRTSCTIFFTAFVVLMSIGWLRRR